MTRFYCDRCDTEIPQNNIRYVITDGDFTLVVIAWKNLEGHAAICLKCVREITEKGEQGLDPETSKGWARGINRC